MRKIVYTAAIAAATLLVAGFAFHSPKTTTAASLSSQVNPIVTPYSVESTIDVKALPHQDIDCRC